MYNAGASSTSLLREAEEGCAKEVLLFLLDCCCSCCFSPTVVSASLSFCDSSSMSSETLTPGSLAILAYVSTPIVYDGVFQADRTVQSERSDTRVSFALLIPPSFTHCRIGCGFPMSSSRLLCHLCSVGSLTKIAVWHKSAILHLAYQQMFAIQCDCRII